MTDKHLTVYCASAGAGKTYQLAQTYITLLLGYYDENGQYRLIKSANPRRHREILAVTFTNKATAEMRTRIIAELSKLADPKQKSDYLTHFRGLLGLEKDDKSADSEIRYAAGQALNSLIFDLGEMQVSTIDSFFQRVLRSFAYEADLAGNYELSLEDEQMTEQAITDLMAIGCGTRATVNPKSVNPANLRNTLVRLITDQASRGDEYKIFNSKSSLRKGLLAFINSLLGEDYDNKSGELEEFFSKPKAVNDFAKGLEVRKAQIEECLVERLNALRSMPAYIDGFGVKYIATIEKFLTEGYMNFTKTQFNYFSVYQEPTDFIKATYRRKYTDLSARADALLEEISVEFSKLYNIETLQRNMKFLNLFRDVLSVRQALKIHLNTVMLSDSNTLLQKIIGDSDTPFIYERIGRQLRHFLIDEFQDTSRLQWANLRPLLLESLSQGRDNLIIGDVKQCIYRFRNSDPELLGHELALDPAISDEYNGLTLASNWRSSKTIVEFNNRFFTKLGQYSILNFGSGASAYNDVEQKVEKVNIPGYVNIKVATPDMAVGRMINEIARQLSSGYEPRDIAVLVRENKDARLIITELLDAVAHGLLPAQTQVLSDEALLVSSAKSVRWIVAQLRRIVYLTDPREQRSEPGTFPHATVYDLDAINEQILRNEADGIDLPVEKALEAFNLSRQQAESREEATRRSLASGLSLFELVQSLISKLPVEEWRSSESLYLNALQDLVLDYCRGRAPSLSGFLNLWDEKLEAKAAVGLAEGVNAIRVMTVHKSKGLEFNCVHIPFLDAPAVDDKKYRWYDFSDYFENVLNIPHGEYPPYFPLNGYQPSNGNITRWNTEIGRIYAGLQNANYIDEINCDYVAFTRAVRELTVTIVSQSGADFFWPHISDAVMPSDPEERVVEIGMPTSPIGKNSKATAGLIQLGDYPLQSRKEMWANTRAASQADTIQ